MDKLTALTATPILIYPDMDESEFLHEFKLMKIRSAAAGLFISGKLPIDDYLDTLAECGVDIDGALTTWNDERSLMGY